MEDKEELQRRVAIYLRVSTDEQAEKYGLDAQRAAIEAMIKSRGVLGDGRPALVLAGEKYVYKDDISGITKLKNRPGFAKLIDDIVLSSAGQKPFDVVAVYKIDRFARRLRVLLDVLNFFDEEKIEFISTSETIDTTTPFGRAMLGILGVIAELELETIKARTSSGKEQAIQKGVYMGPSAPYGYQKDKEKHLVVLEPEAEVVKRIFTSFISSKLSPQKIADDLSSDGILSPEASAVVNNKRSGSSRKINPSDFWRAETVRHILVNPIYTGIRYVNKSKEGKRLSKEEWKRILVPHKAIIAFGIFQLSQKRLDDLAMKKELTKKKEQGHLYLLSSLLKCDHCRGFSELKNRPTSWTGDKKLIKKSGKWSYYYRCGRKNGSKFSKTCTVVPIPAEPLEDYVIKFIKQLLNDPIALFQYQKDLRSRKVNIEYLERRKHHAVELLASLPMRRQNLKIQHEMSIIDTASLAEKLSELDKKQMEIKSKIEEYDFQLTQETLSEGYKKSFEEYAVKYRKVLEQTYSDRQELYDLIHSLIDEIIVYARPKNEKDIIAGKKAEDQFIPNRVDIVLNLPQHLLRILYEQKFGVRRDML